MEGEYIRTIRKEELPPSTMKTVKVQGRYVLLANVKGKVYAMGAICNHRGWDLSEGSLDGFIITCAGHGSKWDLRTGKGKFEEPLPDEPVYEVREEEGYICIRLSK